MNEAIIPQPEIVVNSLDPRQWDGSISGNVKGADPRHFFVSIYMEIGGEWYMLSGGESLQVQIDENHNWSCPVHESRKPLIDKIQIFLFPVGFEPDRLLGEKILPLKLHLAATAKLSIELKH